MTLAPMTDTDRVAVTQCDEASMLLELDVGDVTVILMGHPGRVATTLRTMLDEVLLMADGLGERCTFCHRRGLNCGEFASVIDGTTAHRGCLDDHRHDMSFDEAARIEAAGMDQ